MLIIICKHSVAQIKQSCKLSIQSGPIFYFSNKNNYTANVPINNLIELDLKLSDKVFFYIGCSGRIVRYDSYYNANNEVYSTKFISKYYSIPLGIKYDIIQHKNTSLKAGSGIGFYVFTDGYMDQCNMSSGGCARQTGMSLYKNRLSTIVGIEYNHKLLRNIDLLCSAVYSNFISNRTDYYRNISIPIESHNINILIGVGYNIKSAKDK